MLTNEEKVESVMMGVGTVAAFGVGMALATAITGEFNPQDFAACGAVGIVAGIGMASSHKIADILFEKYGKPKVLKKIAPSVSDDPVLKQKVYEILDKER